MQTLLWKDNPDHRPSTHLPACAYPSQIERRSFSTQIRHPVEPFPGDSHYNTPITLVEQIVVAARLSGPWDVLVRCSETTGRGHEN
jgi:hypothetical protein